MAVSRFKSQHILYRFIAAMVLVFATYNPVGYSYYDWAVVPFLNMSDGFEFSVLKAFAGLVVIIGWAIFIRATGRSLGAVGVTFAALFFFFLFWLLLDQGWLTLDNTDAFAWLILIATAGIMALGMSWSHIRRRMSGQLDVDEHDNAG